MYEEREGKGGEREREGDNVRMSEGMLEQTLNDSEDNSSFVI